MGTIFSCRLIFWRIYSSRTVTDSKETTVPILFGVGSVTYLCSVSLRYFSLSAVLKRSRGFRPSLQVFTFWLSTYTSYRSFFSSKIFSVVPKNTKRASTCQRGFSETSTCFERQLTCNVGELVLQGADIGHINVEEGAELGHRHADPGDGDVCQATAAVHWEGGGGGGWNQRHYACVGERHRMQMCAWHVGCPTLITAGNCMYTDVKPSDSHGKFV